MREKLLEIIELFKTDESILFAVIFSIDGTVLASHIKGREWISALEWAEKQVEVVARQVLEENLNSVEFRFEREGILIKPISRSMLLVVGISDVASLYKVRIDTESLRYD